MTPKLWRMIYWAFLVIFALGLVGFFVFPQHGPIVGTIAFAGLAVGLLIKIVFWVTHQCPKCKKKLDHHFSGFLRNSGLKFVNIEKCIHCSVDLTAWSEGK